MMNPRTSQKGFTLLEMIVAIGVFTVVMLIAVTALLSVLQANREARAMQVVLQNLDFTLDSMARQIRTGTTYHCGTGPSYETRADCQNPPDSEFAFEAKGGTPGDVTDQVVYRLNGTQIERSTTGGTGSEPFVAVTSPDITVEKFTVFVYGSAVGDGLQPRMLIAITGTASAGKTETSFQVQTNITQRLLDS